MSTVSVDKSGGNFPPALIFRCIPPLSPHCLIIRHYCNLLFFQNIFQEAWQIPEIIGRIMTVA